MCGGQINRVAAVLGSLHVERTQGNANGKGLLVLGGSRVPISGVIHNFETSLCPGTQSCPAQWQAVRALTRWHLGLYVITQIWVRDESNLNQEKTATKDQSHFNIYPTIKLLWFFSPSFREMESFAYQKLTFLPKMHFHWDATLLQMA